LYNGYYYNLKRERLSYLFSKKESLDAAEIMFDCNELAEGHKYLN
jgi:hypothetical protein